MSEEYLAGYIKNDELLKNINYDLLIKTADNIVTLFFDKDLQDTVISDNNQLELF